MGSKARFLALGLVATATASFAGLASCGGDDNKNTADGGSDGSGDVVTADNFVPPSNCDAGVVARTCTAKDCTAKAGEPAVCVANQCVKVKSAECQEIVGPVDNDDAILIGSLLSTHGSDSLAGKTRVHAAALAVNEINTTAGGVYTADGCGRRPLVYVSCDDSNEPINRDAGPEAGVYDRVAAAKHLATELGVAAIIGPNNSGNTLEIFSKVTRDSRTIIMPPTSSAAEISGDKLEGGTQDGVRLVWRLVPDDDIQDKALVQLYTSVAAELARAGKTTLKVAIISRQDAYGQGNLNGMKAGLTLNGKPYTDPANDANHLERSYATTGMPPAAVWQDVLAFQPDVIFHFGLGEFSTGIIAPYEDNNVADGGVTVDGGDGGTTIQTGNPPIWLTTSSGQRGDLLNVLKTRQAVGKRIRGTTSLVITPLAQDFFNFRYKVAYPNDTPSLLGGMANAYDAVYMIAFGATSTQVASGAAFKSSTLGRGFAKLVGGATQIDVGPAKLKAGLELALQGQTFDFNGASGPLDFDPLTGQAPGDFSIWCIRTDPNTLAPVFENVTGQYWSYRTSTLTGTYTCPQ